MALKQAVFGPGSLFVKSSTGAYQLLADVQGFTFDVAKDVKELYGNLQFPIDVATSTIKVTGKLKKATFSAAAFNNIFFGQTSTTGQVLTAVNEAGTIPSATTYTITVSHSANYSSDLGVIYADGSAALQYIPSGTPTVGQYTVSAGVYTFAAADAGKAVLISYKYTSTTGVSIMNSQQLIGTTVVFSLYYVTQHLGQELNIECYQAIAPKLAMDFKQTDFTIPELDLMFFANAAGQVYNSTASA